MIPVYCIGLHVQFSRSAEKARPPGTPAGRSLKTQQHAGALCSRLGPEGHRLAGACAPFQFRSTFQEPLELDDAVCAGGCKRPLQSWSFPRKEVIQPHLPVRLPCYDFTPVTSPTFDGSLPEGLGHRLWVLLASVL